MYFNQAKNEKEVFELWHYGENNCNIAKQLNVSEGTVRNRKKSCRFKELITIYSRCTDNDLSYIASSLLNTAAHSPALQNGLMQSRSAYPFDSVDFAAGFVVTNWK